LSFHRAQTGFVKSRAAQINQIRELLAEFGIVFPPDIVAFSRHVPALPEDAENCLTMPFRQLSSYL
ncbi:IS110 family transposase, partial [Escherichia coli]